MWAVEAARGAAEALGLFSSIEKYGPQSVGALATRLEVAAPRLEAVVDILVLDGALAWRAARGGELVLGDGRGAPASSTAEALVEVLRSDRALVADETLAGHHAHLFTVGRAAAEALWARLGADGSLVDLGGGQGAYAAAWLDGGARRTATLVDRPAVVELARVALGPHPRLRLVEADIVDGGAAVGSDHDVALLANVLHLLAPHAAARAVATAARAVRRGGLVVVKDLRVEHDRSGPPAALIFSLTMALYSDGTVYDVPTVRVWLDGAGLADVRTFVLPEAPDSIVVVGRRA